MYLQKLSLINYKNIREATLEFSPSLNCFFGNNGQGKTNLLDAVYYLSFCKSHSNPIDAQNIHHEADFLMLQGDYREGEQEETYYCGIRRRQRKVFKHDKKAYQRLSEHIGRLPLVLISPFDEELIREGGEERRRFLDMAISQYDVGYMQALIGYEAALTQRNAMLKDEEGRFDASLFEIYEISMAKHGNVIYRKRREFVEAFVPVFENYYHIISGGQEKPGLRYISHLDNGPLDTQLAQTRERDRLIGHSTRGIHKDDLEITMDGYPLKRVGSQGQTKTCLIAMKLAQFVFLKQVCGRTPILLLDDIFDKLDEQRVEKIISLVAQKDFGQIFITDTSLERLEPTLKDTRSDCRVFRIEDGEVAEYRTL